MTMEAEFDKKRGCVECGGREVALYAGTYHCAKCGTEIVRER